MPAEDQVQNPRLCCLLSEARPKQLSTSLTSVTTFRPKIQTGAIILPLRKSIIEKSLYHELFQRLYDGALITDLQGQIVDANTRAQDLFGHSHGDLLSLRITEIIYGADESLLNAIQSNLKNHRLTLIEAYCNRKDGAAFPTEIAANHLQYANEDRFCFFVRDISRRKAVEDAVRKSKEELEQMNHRLQDNQAQLAQSEKMAAIGQIAAGVAHEINNPVGFVISNLSTLAEYVGVFKKLLEQYALLVKAKESADLVGQNQISDQISQIEAKEDLDYLLKDVDHLLEESADGANRVKEIVQGLKSFARLDESELKEANINEGIEATLKIIWNELKYKCQVHKKLGELPLIRCYMGQLNQVFINLLINAAQAIPTQGEIAIETFTTDRHIVIRISDTGPGIAPENMSKLFTPFFTTKPVGKGTGLGLSISYGIVKKHNGTIEVKSALGKGTTFTIHLPIEGVPHE